MSNKPNLKNFIEVNSKAFNFKKLPDCLVYEDKETRQLYKEVNAFSNRLRIEIPYAVFAVIMYVLSLTMPQLKIWDFSIYIIIIWVVFIYLLSFIVLRYFFTKFEPIQNENEAAGTGYKQIELALVIVPSVLLLLI